jgi:hypothetical protein
MGGHQEHGGEPDVPEHKPHDAAGKRYGEAPCAERGQLERLQGGGNPKGVRPL